VAWRRGRQAWAQTGGVPLGSDCPNETSTATALAAMTSAEEARHAMRRVGGARREVWTARARPHCRAFRWRLAARVGEVETKFGACQVSRRRQGRNGHLATDQHDSRRRRTHRRPRPLTCGCSELHAVSPTPACLPPLLDGPHIAIQHLKLNRRRPAARRSVVGDGKDFDRGRNQTTPRNGKATNVGISVDRDHAAARPFIR
jgi:hypothetical protein